MNMRHALLGLLASAAIVPTTVAATVTTTAMRRLRHAAANFSAFVTDLGKDEGEFNEIVEGFAQMLEYYIKRTRPGDAGGTGSTGLNQLIEQAKNEL